MKRNLFYIFTITLVLVISLTVLGLINYIDSESLKNSTSVADSISADILDLQTEMSVLYLDKKTYEEDQADIKGKLEEVLKKETISAEERTALVERLNEVETSISNLEQEIEDAVGSTEELYLKKQEFEEEKQSIEDRLAQLDAEDIVIKNDIEALTNKITEIETKITNIQNEIDSLQSSIDELYAMVEGMNKSILTACLSADETVSVTTVHSVALTKYNATGTELTVDSSGAIVVGENVSKVLVSFNVNIQIASLSSYAASFYINDTERSMMNETTDGSFLTLSCSPLLINVEGGDVISLVVEGGAPEYKIRGGNILRTWMTVEVVE